MKKELCMERRKITMERDPDGTLKFFEVINGKVLNGEFKIQTYQENLCDVMDCALRQLNNFKETLDDGEDPGYLYYLLEGMIDDARFKLMQLCTVLENQFGKINVHVCGRGVSGIMNNTPLCAESEEG